jgi:hypothetical protein
MASAPDLDPPWGLHRRILDFIVLPSTTRFSRFTSVWATPGSYGLALAAGVLLAVGVYQIAPRDSASIEDMVGTMVLKGNHLPGAPYNELRIDIPAVNGQIRLKPVDQAWVLEFDLRSAEVVDVDIDLGAAGFTFGGFASQDPAVENFEVSGGKLHLQNQGNHGFTLFLLEDPAKSEGPRKIEVAVNHQGNNVFHGMLESTGG